jgi:hypothetical protein
MVEDEFADMEMIRAKMREAKAERQALAARLADLDAGETLPLHPGIEEVYRRQIDRLGEALAAGGPEARPGQGRDPRADRPCRGPPPRGRPRRRPRAARPPRRNAPNAKKPPPGGRLELYCKAGCGSAHRAVQYNCRRDRRRALLEVRRLAFQEAVDETGEVAEGLAAADPRRPRWAERLGELAPEQVEGAAVLGEVGEEGEGEAERLGALDRAGFSAARAASSTAARALSLSSAIENRGMRGG